jgi:hypothetical protein
MFFRNVDKHLPDYTTSHPQPITLCIVTTWEPGVWHKLEGFDNRVLKIISGPKRAEVAEEWRKIYNLQFSKSYRSPEIIKAFK